MVSIYSVLYAGLKTSDAFAAIFWMTIVKGLFWTVSFVSTIYRVTTAKNFVYKWMLEEIVEIIDFFLVLTLVWPGFIFEGSVKSLKIWLFASTTLNFVMRMVVPMTFFVDTRHTWIKFELMWPTINLNLFDISYFLISFYIYFIAWLALMEVQNGYAIGGSPLAKFQGYGHGIDHFFDYYLKKYERMAAILFLAQGVWNIFIFVHLDLSWEISYFGNQNGTIFTHIQRRPLILLRCTRILSAGLGFYFVRKKMHFALKSLWLPLQIFWLGVEMYILHFLPCRPNEHVFDVPAYYTETGACFILNLVAICTVFKCLSKFSKKQINKNGSRV